MRARLCNARPTSSSWEGTAHLTIPSTLSAALNSFARRQSGTIYSIQCLGITMAMSFPKRPSFSERTWISEFKTTPRTSARAYFRRASYPAKSSSGSSTHWMLKGSRWSRVVRQFRSCTTLRWADIKAPVNRLNNPSALTRPNPLCAKSLIGSPNNSMKSRDASKNSAPRSTKSRATCRSTRHLWRQVADEIAAIEANSTRGRWPGHHIHDIPLPVSEQRDGSDERKELV